MKEYINLTKPGIILGNAVTAVGGFFLASKGDVDFILLISMLVGLSLVIASACVLNNVFDREIDSRMERTKNRAIVTGSISKPKALIFGIILLLPGLALLFLHTTYYTLLAALLAWFVYVAIYTPLKPKTSHATLIGSIAGASPVVAGYVAVTNKFDLGAILLFVILVSWQMPHFYAIALYRLHEYKAAGIPVLPIVKGLFTTKLAMTIYIIFFILALSLLTVFNYTGYVYFGIMLLLGLTWLRKSIRGFSPQIDTTIWARNMFKFSLMVLLAFSIMISLNPVV
ncbi:MAG: protoheme IX farnesyltransferase [Candidatus Doudnabacteria bacterium RIFCSPLOWO2_02_FULL_42_9]|uniref:Protoheme IX farnesyltransferase n=1 Tax=Candidatus Doudnabacteria bacterium RIFCSPHIGHO2_01_FULL_41_86 TaxID=1817821 RepID=A0A1F5N844_9BACT|nr:MAG: protoheme IX farnesyltransferase [Candidatus Doudnabacteria bacterium RIFCSPHIGHO2_01_FULL_41_86]OGE75297.1 MAG: protoheme IX farnesyltransferase [Candidatus Doudnabacteria bacterium RIFCSPHIGHO2_01_43_10]OGE85823.1 MAG: protoheme IX farnesyltransferase [Candidatus Doudnabacteria bacterium RIFCSPHIGHO2_12_FULL_42_22]OGE87317.1 MAG: protoheme IX farnesyltransferase [Candidatus Doudnabacteria bacterium RIFCSPHIGHO2_02_FULL_42_25]OGE92155.1 MAG: protoheme IX farnesyltransferase [Candidatus